MKSRFSILTLLICISFAGVYLAGYRTGMNSGLDAMHNIHNRIEVLATIQHDETALGESHLFQRAVTTNNGETFRLTGEELNGLFVEITPIRITDQTASSAAKINKSTITLKNVSVAELEKQIKQTTPQLIASNSVSINPNNNSITVNDDSTGLLANVAAAATFSDKRPVIYEAQIRIGRIQADGSERLLHEPTISTMENLSAKFEVGDLAERIAVNLKFDDIPKSQR